MSSGRSIGILASLNIVGAVVGVLSSVVIAHLFGTSRLLEVYFAATTTQYLVISLSQTGQLGDILLPIYHQVREAQGSESAQRAYAVTVNWAVLASVALSGLLWLAAPLIMRLLVPGFGPEEHALGARMFRYLLPLVPLQIACSLVAVLANAERWFGKPELVNVSTQAVILATMVLLVRPIGFWALIVSAWVGQVFQFVGLLVLLRRMRFRYTPRLRHESFRVASVFGQLTYTFGYVAATQVWAFAQNAGFSLLPQGTYAVFKYVQQLYSKTNTVLLRPVGVVLFTYASEAVARGSRDVRELMRTALMRNLAIASLAVVAIFAGGDLLLGAIWGSRRFGADQLLLAGRLLKLFFLLLFAEGAGQIARRVAVALGLVKESYLAASAMQLVSAVTFWVLATRFALPGALTGFVLAVLILNAGYFLPLLTRARATAAFYDPRQALLWGGCVAAGLGASTLLERVLGLQAMGLPRAGMLAAACVLSGTAVLVSLAAARLLGIGEVEDGWRWVRARLAFRRAAGG